MSSFFSLTADQYKNWVVHYSIICLHGLLPADVLECWRHFVLACRLLCQTELKRDDIIIADALILKFCQRMERMFGKEVITPNMHMSCHLKDCILDYGPLNHFWLFAFERFNGILSHMPNNNESIEVQIMKRFLNEQEVTRISFPSEFEEEFSSAFSFEHSCTGSLEGDAGLLYKSVSDCPNIFLPRSYTRNVFNTAELNELEQYLSTCYPSNIQVNSTYKQYTSVVVNGKSLGSYNSKSQSSSIILAEYHGEVRPGRIRYFAAVSLVSGDKQINKILVCLSWFQHHDQKIDVENLSLYGSTISLIAQHFCNLVLLDLELYLSLTNWMMTTDMCYLCLLTIKQPIMHITCFSNVIHQ